MFSIFHFYIQFITINAINKRTTCSIGMGWELYILWRKKAERFPRNHSFSLSNQFTWQFSYTLSSREMFARCSFFMWNFCSFLSSACAKTDLNLTYDLRKSQINELKIVNDAQVRIHVTKKFSSPTSIVFRLYFSMQYA